MITPFGALRFRAMRPTLDLVRRVAALVASAAAFLPSAAHATAPAGFVDNATLDARAAWVAGKPVQVHCTTSYAVWRDFIGTLTYPPSDGVTMGYTPTDGGAETYLAPAVCANVFQWLAHEPVNLPILGTALLVVAHESLHMKGVQDEGATECRAFRLMPAFAARWGFRKGSGSYKLVLSGARTYHDALTGDFRSVC